MAQASQFQESTCQTDASIVISTDTRLSNKLDLQGTTVEGFLLPAGLTSTSIRFRVAINASDPLLPLYDSNGSRLALTCDADARAIGVDNSLFRGWRFLQLDMGSAEAANCTITVMTKPS